MDTVIRLAGESDLAEADRVFCTAFKRPGSMLAHLQLHLAIAPDMFWLAEEQGQIVGTVGAADYGAIAYVGLMAVDPAYQRRGIARRLLETALAAIDARGCTIARLDATGAGAPLYEQLGFVDDGTSRVVERDAGAANAGAHRAKFVVSAAEDLAEVVVLDRAAFGAGREKLLAAHWNEHRRRCLVARSAGRAPVGYVFARGAILGPWVAEDAPVAEALLARALEFDFASPPQVMVPRGNSAAVELLARWGFTERRVLRHMRRGTPLSTEAPSRTYGQSSFAHG